MSKKKRWEWLFCIGILWTAAVFQGYALTRQREEAKSLEAFFNLHLSSLEGNLELSASPVHKLSEEKQRALLKKLAKSMGGNQTLSWEEERSRGEISIRLFIEQETGSTEMTFTTRDLPKDMGAEGTHQNLFITLYSKEQMEQLLERKNALEKAMKKAGLSPFSNLMIKGMKTGNMTMEEKAATTEELFRVLHAEEIDAIRTEELYTVYGYSRILGDAMTIGGNEINVNLAFHYDEEKGRTVFYLAMPYIRIDY